MISLTFSSNGETIMRRSASEIIRNLESRIARLEKSSGLFDGLLDSFDPIKDAENVEAFKVDLKSFISNLRRERPHTLAKNLQNILDLYALENSPKKNPNIRISVLHSLSLGQRNGLKVTAKQKISPSNFKEQNIDRTEDKLVKLLNYRLLK